MRLLALSEGVTSWLCDTWPNRGVLWTQEGQTCPKAFSALTRHICERPAGHASLLGGRPTRDGRERLCSPSCVLAVT